MVCNSQQLNFRLLCVCGFPLGRHNTTKCFVFIDWGIRTSTKLLDIQPNSCEGEDEQPIALIIEYQFEDRGCKKSSHLDSHPIHQDQNPLQRRRDPSGLTHIRIANIGSAGALRHGLPELRLRSGGQLSHIHTECAGDQRTAPGQLDEDYFASRVGCNNCPALGVNNQWHPGTSLSDAAEWKNNYFGTQLFPQQSLGTVIDCGETVQCE